MRGMAEAGMKLYGDPASPYVTRVLMAARLKGLEIEHPPVPGGNPRSEAFSCAESHRQGAAVRARR